MTFNYFWHAPYIFNYNVIFAIIFSFIELRFKITKVRQLFLGTVKSAGNVFVRLRIFQSFGIFNALVNCFFAVKSDLYWPRSRSISVEAEIRNSPPLASLHYVLFDAESGAACIAVLFALFAFFFHATYGGG